MAMQLGLPPAPSLGAAADSQDPMAQLVEIMKAIMSATGGGSSADAAVDAIREGRIGTRDAARQTELETIDPTAMHGKNLTTIGGDQGPPAQRANLREQFDARDAASADAGHLATPRRAAGESLALYRKRVSENRKDREKSRAERKAKGDTRSASDKDKDRKKPKAPDYDYEDAESMTFY